MLGSRILTKEWQALELGINKVLSPAGAVSQLCSTGGDLSGAFSWPAET